MSRRKRAPPTGTDEETLEAVRRDPAVLRETLPGALELDEALLDDLVGQLNRIYATRSIATARDIAERVVEVLGLGDLQDFLAVARVHATWHAMKKRADLLMPFARIWSSIAVLDQLRRLRKDLGDALPIEHHKRLLVVKDEAALVELAETAVARKLTAAQLSTEIHARGLAAPKGGRGRKRLPPVVKSVRAATKTFADFQPDPADASLGAEDLDALLAALEKHDRALDRVREHLTALRSAVT